MLGGEEQTELTSPDIQGTILASGSFGGAGGITLPFSCGAVTTGALGACVEDAAAKCSPNCSPTRMKAILRQRLSSEAKSGVAMTSRVSAAIFVTMMSSRVICCAAGGAAAAAAVAPSSAAEAPSAAALVAVAVQLARSGWRAASIKDWKVGAQMAWPVAVVEPDAGFMLSPDST